MSNHTSLPKLDIPEMKSNLTDIDDTSQSLNWKDDVPDDFANELKPPSPNKYKKKLPPEAFTKKNKQVNLPVTKEADLKAASDEVYRAEEEARALENRDENEMVDIDNPLMEELSPMMEDDEISHPASNFGDEAVDSGGTRTAFDELGANFGNDSDSGSEYNASACENVLEIDPMCTSKPMASDFADSPASDNTSDVANNMMESTTESNTESSQSREPYTHEDCRGCISKSQEVASRDKRIAELELQIATFTNKATSYTNAYTNTETLANKVVSYTEACTNTEMLANKAVSYTDASTNTETRPEQNRQPSYPREGDTERQVSTSNSLLLSSLPLPLATSLPTQVTAARFIYDCLDLVKMLYLVLTDLLSGIGGGVSVDAI
ncbi:hypothetical protein ACHAQJ_010027 [Trichoderma viride]